MQRMFCVDAIRYKLRQMSTLAITSTLVLSALAPVLLMGQASAAQITERKITMSTSVRGATANYVVSFKPATSITAMGMVIQFCSDSPLVGASCTGPANGNTLEGFSAASATVSGSWTKDGSSTANTLILTHTGDTLTAGNAYTLTLTGVTNPTYDGIQPATFYARVLTYTGSPVGYTATAPGSFTDQGGIAMTTNSQLTVNARVQEELEFCVGTVDNTVVSDGTTPANCGASAFSSATPTVDLGTVSSASLSVSPVAAVAGGNNMNGAAMIRTNAVNGATIIYFAEQNAGSGRLKVAGASCSGNTVTGVTDATSGVTDQCFNSNSSPIDFGSTPGEKFGMTSSAVYRPTGSTTTNLTRNGDYDDANEYAWQSDGTTSTLATSTTVMDYEMLLLRFAAQAAATTPTGSYTVTSTYIATSTF